METAGHVLCAVGCSGWIADVVCADNTVVIPMRVCDRGKPEARGTRSAEGAPCEDRHARSNALTASPGDIERTPGVAVAVGARWASASGGSVETKRAVSVHQGSLIQ